MTSPTSLNEYNAAELPPRELLEKLGWEYVPREDAHWSVAAAYNGLPKIVRS